MKVCSDATRSGCPARLSGEDTGLVELLRRAGSGFLRECPIWGKECECKTDGTTPMPPPVAATP